MIWQLARRSLTTRVFYVCQATSMPQGERDTLAGVACLLVRTAPAAMLRCTRACVLQATEPAWHCLA